MTTRMDVFLEIALSVPLRSTFTYRYKASLNQPPPLGARVRVPFGSRVVVGITMHILSTPSMDEAKIKDIVELIDREAIVPESLLVICRWASAYYHHPIGEVLFAALPQRYREGKTHEQKIAYRHTQEGLGLPASALGRAKKQQLVHEYLLEHKNLDSELIKGLDFSQSAIKGLENKGLIEKHESVQPRETAQPKDLKVLKEPAKCLNGEQRAAFEQIRYHHYTCYLLEGATGSGKTELYLHVINRILQSNQQALVLIPEIGLSAQTISRFKKRFNVKIAELHSNIAENERARSWRAAMTGEAKIIIGTRLASLTPFANLGAIIIDEEHDQSYKQQDGFRYSARDLSIYRAHLHGIPIILGSATPSLESLLNVSNGKYKKLTIKERAGKANPPEIKTIDLRNQTTTAGLSHSAIEALKATISKNEQAIIFINKRGFAQSLICHHCGWTADCQYCDTRMTLHKNPYHLRCHSCDRTKRVPRQCGNCASDDLLTSGLGTEQLEQSLKTLLSGIPIIRVDRDSTRNKNAMEKKLAIGNTSEACVFVGTQMLAKGHHLPNLTLVIVVEADQGLLGSDFRSTEHMGQLITQVSGRAGRESKPGKVLVQTHRPEHPLLNILLERGYPDFARSILTSRKHARLPPFTNCVIFRSESKRAENSVLFLNQVKTIILRESKAAVDIQLLGPAPSAIEKINDRYRFILQILCPSRAELKSCIAQCLIEVNQLASGKRTRWSIDVDPITSN